MYTASSNKGYQTFHRYLRKTKTYFTLFLRHHAKTTLMCTS